MLLFDLHVFFVRILYKLDDAGVLSSSAGRCGRIAYSFVAKLACRQQSTEKQGTALGFWAMVVVVAPVLGPIIGGYLTDVYSWPWIFYINVPIGIFSAACHMVFLKDRESEIETQAHRLGRAGFSWLSAWLPAGHARQRQRSRLVQSNIIIALTVTSLVSLAISPFGTITMNIVLSIFSFLKPQFCLWHFGITIGFLLYFASTVTIPLWLQTEQNYTAYWAGIAVAPIGIAPVFLSTTVGKFLHQVDLVCCFVEFFDLLCGILLPDEFYDEVDLHTIMLDPLFSRVRIAVFFLPITFCFMRDSQKCYASASGLYHFIRILVGSGFGTSLSVYLWWYRQVVHHERLGESITDYNTNTVQLYQNLDSMFHKDVINGLVDMSVEPGVHDVDERPGLAERLAVPGDDTDHLPLQEHQTRRRSGPRRH